MMGTAENLSTKDNIDVVTFMETENIRIAKAKGFIRIFTTNTNPCTQQLDSQVFGYRTLSNFQVNQYVDAEGNRPYSKAPDSQKALVVYKDLIN